MGLDQECRLATAEEINGGWWLCLWNSQPRNQDCYWYGAVVHPFAVFSTYFDGLKIQTFNFRENWRTEDVASISICICTRTFAWGKVPDYIPGIVSFTSLDFAMAHFLKFCKILLKRWGCNLYAALPLKKSVLTAAADSFLSNAKIIHLNYYFFNILQHFQLVIRRCNFNIWT